MTIKNKLCDILNIEYPILQGGMAWVATGELAAAVSEAGGLGVIGAGNAPGDVVREEIIKAKKKTDKPFAVNLMLMSPFIDDVIDVVIEEGVSIVTTGAGNPGKYIDRFKKENIKVIPVVASVALGRRMQRLGVEAMIAEGHEAGGHIGKVTTMSFIPQLVDKVDIPVIAAGGIADGRGMAAALSLGAEGIQMGTRFVCSKECTASKEFKNTILKAKDRDAVVTGRSTGHPVRNIKNKLTRKMEKLESKGVSKEKIEELGSGKLRLAAVEGETDHGSVMAGQIAGMIDDILSVSEIIDNTINECEEIFLKNCDKVGGND
ncbi:MAG: enoyl-[acyl-carrier-protein] reductase FabK [Bacillota bacterium]